MPTRQKLISVLLACSGLSAYAGPQNPQPLKLEFDGNMRADVDDEKASQEFHIALTKEGWTAALQHPRSDVRGYAALRLASHGYKDTIPAILAALKIEPIAGAQTTLAFSVALLGAEEGFTALKRMCADPGRAPVLRMVDARVLLDLHREDCLQDVLDVLRLRPDDQATVLALNVLPRFSQTRQDDAAEIRSLISDSLKSPSTLVRMGASYALRQIGSPWAVEQLRNAVAAEHDANVNRILEADLSLISR